MLLLLYIVGGLTALGAFLFSAIYIGEWVATKLGPGKWFTRFWRSWIMDRDPFDDPNVN